MSIASEITRINGNIAAAYTALDGKGATLPETQNSANLDDTINTISAGGGYEPTYRGNWLVPQLYLEIDAKTDDTTNAMYQAHIAHSSKTEPKVIGLALFKGYYTITIGSVFSTYVEGMCISDGRMYHSSILGSEAPEGSTLLSSNSEITIDNTLGDKYIIIYTTKNCNQLPIGYNTDVFGVSLRVFSTSNQHILKFTKYACFKNVFVNYFKNSQFESFNIIGTLASASKMAGAKDVVFNPDFTQFGSRYYIPPISTWCTTDTISVKVSNLQSRGIYCFPDGLVISTTATSGTLYIGYSDATFDNNLPLTNFNRAYITLPSTINVNINSYITLTEDNWSYIAEHAPSVSGLTLTIGSANIAACGGSSGTIITTLTNKGWTVN